MTLTICKPMIRASCQEGDFIVGITAEQNIAFIMQVTEKLDLERYWQRCKSDGSLKVKIPNQRSAIAKRGDAIYDFSSSSDTILQLKGSHLNKDMDRDLRGGYAILSSHFVYAGKDSILLPANLQCVANIRRGHRSVANRPYWQVFQLFLKASSASGFKTIHGNMIEWGHVGKPPHA